MINAIICSLIQNPFVNNVMAAEKKNNGGFTANDILSLANGGLNVYAGFLGQKQQIIQQQIAAANNQKIMSQLGPACRKPDGTACYSTPAKYFPECALPASISNMPQNACGNPTPEVNQISAMVTYEAISNGWINYYDQMANKASNSAYPAGLRCLEDKQKALDSQLIEMSNSLQRLQDQLNQDKQVFRDNNKKLLEEMNTANDELFGGDKNNLDTKTQDFRKYFSQSCQSVIGEETLNNGKSLGMSGVLQGLSSSSKAASDFNLNKSVIENDVHQEAAKITAAINAGGIDDWLNNAKTQADIKSGKYPSIETSVKNQAAEFNTARARITKELAVLGYTPPAMDKNFTADMNDFMTHSTDFFKKKYVNDCVTGADKGIAIPVEDILKSLEQRRTNSSGTVTSDYRIALKNILDSEDMMNVKMEKIKALEPQFPGITITYKNETQSSVTESPYSLFMKTIDKCEQRYVQDEKFSSKGSNGVSYQKKVERGRAALQELKNLNDSFSSKITHSITDQVLNCNGEASKSGNECSKDSLKTTSDNFCVSHASKCANEIQGCYNEANNHVQVRKTKMQNLAKTFNANVAAMVARSNQLFEQQKAGVTNITKLIQAKFPGTNFELPKDMFVSMPELKKDAFGVEMAGDGNLASFLDGESSMPAKIEKLKEMFKKQRETLNTEIGNYIALQEGAMQEQRGRWEKLAGECKGAVDSSSKALAQMNNEGQKNQQELNRLVGKYCAKYANLRDNPNGGCDEAKDLATTWDKIVEKGGENYITGSASKIASQYNSACNATNNEALDGDLPESCLKDGKPIDNKRCSAMSDALARKLNAQGKSSSPKKLTAEKLCGSDYKATDADFIKNASAKLPKELKSKIEGKTTLNEVMAVLKSEEVEDLDFFENIQDNFKPDAGKICETLKDRTVANATSADELAELNSKLKEEQDKVASAKKDVKDSQDKIDAKNSTPQEKTTAKSRRDAAEEIVNTNNVASLKNQIKEAKDATKTDKTKLAKKEELDSLLSDLNSYGHEVPESRLANLGEQLEEQSSCDATNTSMLTKNNDFDFLKNHDMGILGTAR